MGLHSLSRVRGHAALCVADSPKMTKDRGVRSIKAQRHLPSRPERLRKGIKHPAQIPHIAGAACTTSSKQCDVPPATIIRPMKASSVPGVWQRN